MSVLAAIATLDKEIELLQSRLGSKRPEADLEAFARLRALSFGRTFLRMIPAAEKATWREIEDGYRLCRLRLVKEGDKQAPELPAGVVVIPEELKEKHEKS